jgi:hypothetical protein
MADDNYTVRIDRSQGLVEVSGSDKAWVAEQLDKLSAVYEADVPAQAAQTTPQPPQTPKQKPKSRSSGRKAKAKGSPRAKVVPELKAKLTAEVRKKLEGFVKERQAAWDQNVGNQAAILATFMTDELGQDSISADELYTFYNVMGWPAAGNPRSQLTNAKDRQGYFGGWSNGRIPLTHTGENFGRIGSKA